MDFTLTEFEGELRDLGRSYAEGEIAPVAARAWHDEYNRFAIVPFEGFKPN